MGTISTNEFAPETETPEAKKAKLEEIARKYVGNDTLNQRSRLLAALTLFPVTTIEIRRHLDILHPAGRIKELRRCGWQIDMIRVRRITEFGKIHSVGLYILRRRNDDA